MTPDVVIADETFLPAAPIVKTGIYAREGLNLRRIMPLVQILEGLLRPPTATHDRRFKPSRRRSKSRRAGAGA